MQEIASGKIEAVIFDMDGTLVDSEPNYYESDRRLLAEYGIPEYNEQLKQQYIGIGTRAMMNDVIRNFNLTESIEVLIAKKNRYYLEIARENTTVFPAMKKFLEILHAHGYPMAVASGSSPEIIEEILKITGLHQFFAVILSADAVDQGKPEPDLFLETARRLKVPPAHCLVLEDSQYGVEAAHRASMRCIAIPSIITEVRPDCFAAADIVFENGMADFDAQAAFTWLANQR